MSFSRRLFQDLIHSVRDFTRRGQIAEPAHDLVMIGDQLPNVRLGQALAPGTHAPLAEKGYRRGLFFGKPLRGFLRLKPLETGKLDSFLHPARIHGKPGKADDSREAGDGLLHQIFITDDVNVETGFIHPTAHVAAPR